MSEYDILKSLNLKTGLKLETPHIKVVNLVIISDSKAIKPNYQTLNL